MREEGVRLRERERERERKPRIKCMGVGLVRGVACVDDHYHSTWL